MKTKNTSLKKITQANARLAVCTFELKEIDSAVQLLPAGEFKSAHDTRPKDTSTGHWFIDARIAEQLIQQRASMTNDLLFDYEHQTLNSDSNGQPAPAAGWGKNGELEWREGEGLFIRSVDWTDKAKAHIKAKEYRYISPVFLYDQLGHVTRLLHVAITNFPAIDGMAELAALRSHNDSQTQFNHPLTKDNSMNEALQLLALLGVTVEDDVTTSHVEQGVAALKALKEKADSVTDKDQQIAVLKAKQDSEVDISQFVPIATYNKVVGEVAVLRAQNQGLTTEQLIEDAVSEGKAFEPERDYLTDLGQKKGVAALKSLLDGRQGIAALKGKQTDTVDKPNETDQGSELSKEELAVCKASGINPEEFKKHKGAI